MLPSAALLLAFAWADPPSDWSEFEDFEFVEDEEDPDSSPSAGEGTATREDEAAQERPKGRAPKKPASEIMSGSLRLTGAYLAPPDLPEPLPSSSDGILTTVGRLIIDHSWSRAKLEVNVFGDMSRVPEFASAGGSFTSAGQTDSAYRNQYLTPRIWTPGQARGSVGFDRLKVAVEAGPATIELGRFPINESVAFFFTPNDYFAPFSATAVNRIYKPGIDGLRTAFTLGPLSSIDVTAALGFEDGYHPDWGHSAVLLRASTVKWGFAWSVHGGKVAQRWVAGGSFQGDLGRVGIRGEGHVGIPDLEGDGRKGQADEARRIHGRLSAGPNLMFDWHNASLGAEYAFFSDGAASPDDYIARSQRFFPDDLPYLAQHYVGVNAGMEIIPILQASTAAIVNASDGSGLVTASMVYSVADEADLIGGLFVPWGTRASVRDDPLMPLDLGSEFGNGGLTLYFESRVFF